MKKKISIGILALIIIVCSLGGWYVLKGQKASIIQNGELSERSKEYIETQKKTSDDAAWRSVNFDKKRLSEEDLEGQEMTFEGCYLLPVPFATTKSEERNPCVNAISLSPSGLLTVTYKESNASGYADVPDVSFRRLKSDTYVEQEENIGGRTFITFKNTAGTYEKTAFLLKDGYTLIVALTMSSNEDLDPKFESILKGIKLL